ncbi:MAG TPA: hypothetical protein VD999_06485 [Vitreimonas sp.]|nr:hypothetical protein [Vitreimonas sp.]
MEDNLYLTEYLTALGIQDLDGTLTSFEVRFRDLGVNRDVAQLFLLAIQLNVFTELSEAIEEDEHGQKLDEGFKMVLHYFLTELSKWEIYQQYLKPSNVPSRPQPSGPEIKRARDSVTTHFDEVIKRLLKGIERSQPVLAERLSWSSLPLEKAANRNTEVKKIPSPKRQLLVTSLLNELRIPIRIWYQNSTTRTSRSKWKYIHYNDLFADSPVPVRIDLDRRKIYYSSNDEVKLGVFLMTQSTRFHALAFSELEIKRWEESKQPSNKKKSRGGPRNKQKYVWTLPWPK